MFDLRIHQIKKPNSIFLTYYLVYWETTEESLLVVPDTGVVINHTTWKDNTYV